MKQKSFYIAFFKSWIFAWSLVMIFISVLLAVSGDGSFNAITLLSEIWTQMDNITLAQKLSTGALYLLGWGAMAMLAKAERFDPFLMMSGVIGLAGALLMRTMMQNSITGVQFALFLACGLLGGIYFALSMKKHI